MTRWTGRMKTCVGIALATLVVAGCGMLFTRSEQHTTTSAIDYLYPNATTERVVQQGVSVLSLPMRVGLAFVPDN